MRREKINFKNSCFFAFSYDILISDKKQKKEKKL